VVFSGQTVGVPVPSGQAVIASIVLQCVGTSGHDVSAYGQAVCDPLHTVVCPEHSVTFTNTSKKLSAAVASLAPEHDVTTIEQRVVSRGQAVTVIGQTVISGHAVDWVEHAVTVSGHLVSIFGHSVGFRGQMVAVPEPSGQIVATPVAAHAVGIVGHSVLAIPQ